MKSLLLTFAFLCLCAASVYAQEAKIMDQFGRVPCDEHLARMDLAISLLKEYPGGKVYFMMYEGPVEIWDYRTKKTILMDPIYGSFQAKVASMKRYISRWGHKLDNYVFVDGGYRDGPVIEVWIVPAGAQPPKPTPTISRIRFRKGKPKGFCTDCC